MFKNYIKIAFKVMLRQKFFTAVNLFGISFTVMIFTIITGMLTMMYGDYGAGINRSRSLYVEGYKVTDNNQFNYHVLPRNSFDDLKKLKAVEQIVKYRTSIIRSFKRGRQVSFTLAHTDENIWKMYDYTFLEGRAYTAKDVAGGQSYAVITESVKRYYFGNAAHVAGKYFGDNPRLKVIGVVKDVVTVMPAGTETASIWSPLYTTNAGYDRAVILAKSKADFPLIRAQLKKAAELETRSQQIKGSVEVNANTLWDRDDMKNIFLIVLGVLFFIVIIPALNMVGLNVNRIAERSSEIGIRKAFGASSNTLMGQFIVENLILSLIGGVLGTALTFAISGFITQLIYFDSPEQGIAAGNFLFNWQTMACSFGCVLFFGLVSGLVPAWRMSKLNSIKALKGGEL